MFRLFEKTFFFYVMLIIKACSHKFSSDRAKFDPYCSLRITKWTITIWYL